MTFGLTGPDGRYVIETQAADPCHTFADDGADMEAEAIQSAEFFLDTTPPECTCDDPPFGSTFDSDDVATVDYEVDDGPIGSGVASFSSEIDGFLTDQEATTPIDDGGTIDMYLFYPSLRTVTVTATDNIGNTGQTGCTFTLSPTSASLLNNLNHAQAEGDVPTLGCSRASPPRSTWQSRNTRLVNTKSRPTRCLGLPMRSKVRSEAATPAPASTPWSATASSPTPKTSSPEEADTSRRHRY